MVPVVFASRRCTMPWRSAAPLVATVCPAASRPPMTVGPVQPGVGCAATPRGLSTTMMSSSSYRTIRPATGRDGSAGRGSGKVTCSGGPAVEEHQAVADQFRGLGPGQPEHPGQRGVEPFPVQALGNIEPALALGRHRPSSAGRSAEPEWSGTVICGSGYSDFGLSGSGGAGAVAGD